MCAFLFFSQFFDSFWGKFDQNMAKNGHFWPFSAILVILKF